MIPAEHCMLLQMNEWFDDLEEKLTTFPYTFYTFLLPPTKPSTYWHRLRQSKTTQSLDHNVQCTVCIYNNMHVDTYTPNLHLIEIHVQLM